MKRRNQLEQKMSEILKEMASALFKDPQAMPSAEAAHAALLFSHVAWNRSIGETFTDTECRAILRKFEKSRANLWDEFSTRDWKVLVKQLQMYKQQHYPDDARIIEMCGMRAPGIIHVEWRYADEKQAHL